MVTNSNYDAQVLWSVCWSGGYPIELLNWNIRSEAVRCSLRLERLPYTADVKQHVHIKEFLLTVTL